MVSTYISCKFLLFVSVLLKKVFKVLGLVTVCYWYSNTYASHRIHNPHLRLSLQVLIIVFYWTIIIPIIAIFRRRFVSEANAYTQVYGDNNPVEMQGDRHQSENSRT